MELVADLHVHSRFSRATSRDLDFVALQRTALEKGVGLVGTGDFTHPGWLEEIEAQLEPAEEGLLRLTGELDRAARGTLPREPGGEVRFVLQTEISNIYKRDGRVRKVHNLVYLPSLDAVRRLVGRLEAVGNLGSDGRPILGLDSRHLLDMVLEVDPRGFLVPAHIWTPWFSMLGSKSGFDSVEECFGDLAGEVFAAETGLSSDPPMNWRLSGLDRLTLISSSDAHSAGRLGREAVLLDIEPCFSALRTALATRAGYLGTVELFPEEGKYHLDGHRKCGLRLEPEATRALGGRCPKCGGVLTVGVMSRVLELADRPSEFAPEHAAGFVRLVPLPEVLAEVQGVGSSSRQVQEELRRLVQCLGPELEVLRRVALDDVAQAGGPVLAEALRRVRAGEVDIAAGYDGEYGTVAIFAAGEKQRLFGQMDLLQVAVPAAASPPAPAVRAEPSARSGGRPRPAPGSRAASGGGLDPAQRQGAEIPTGPLLVVAGPGTGKTRTLVARIAHQVETGRVRPDQVLAIAFTNQAADELRERVQRWVPAARGGGPLVTTFHGFGLRLLTELSGASPEVVSGEERLEILGRVAEGREAGERVEALADAVSRLKQAVRVAEDATPGSGLEGLLRRYDEALARRGVVDLDDLVIRPCRLMLADPELAARVAARYRLVAVDEYQDVNDAQAELISLLAPGGGSLCVIGDPDQSIYSFRGARPGHFGRFTEAFPGARVVELDTSYRLTAEVLAAASAVLGRDRGLKATCSGPPVEVAACATAAAEAEQLVVRLERVVGGTSHFAVDTGRGGQAEHDDVSFGDVAVLCRTRAQRAEILAALGRSGVPCRVVGEEEAHDPRSEKVAVMTLHASKGREFEAVFVVGVEEGLVPLDHGGLCGDPEEERRLLYVAMTRARRLLVLSHATRRTLWGRRLPGRPSPFLTGLPEGAVVRTSGGACRHDPPARQLSLF